MFHRPVTKICLLEEVKDDEQSLTVEFHEWTLNQTNELRNNVITVRLSGRYVIPFPAVYNYENIYLSR